MCDGALCILQQCILTTAEKTAEMFDFNGTAGENYTYYSSKYSPKNDFNVTVTEEFEKSLPEIVKKYNSSYERMHLDRDTHFYNISVNTTHSSVHVPTNVYDRSPAVLETLMWSEGQNIYYKFIRFH